MRWARTQTRFRWGVSQSANIRTACGSPCAFDYRLRTEHLADDWAALLLALGMPLVRLPHLNPTGTGHAPRTLFSEEILDIIGELDEEMFSVWGYTRRRVPFEL